MKRTVATLAVILVVLLNPGRAAAMTNMEYSLVGESLYLILALGGLATALAIFRTFKRGSLGKPWLLILLGLAAAAIGSAIDILDLLKIIIHQYDMRPALLVFRTGSIFLILAGLFLYKKGLQ